MMMQTIFRIVPVLAACAGIVTGTAGAAVVIPEIGNEFIRVQHDGKSFDVTDRSTGLKVATQGRFEDGATVTYCREEGVRDPDFGKGRRAVFTRKGADGSGGELFLEVYPKLPFVLIRETVRNTLDKPIDVQKLSIAIFSPELGKPATNLTTLGTGGLLAPNANPGSYLFLTCADPATREGLVSGWVTQFKGSGTVFSSADANGKVWFRAQLEHGHLILQPGQSAMLDTFAIGHFRDARIGMEALADATAKAHHVKLRPRQAVYCSWYSDQHGGPGDEKSSIELGKFIARELKPYGMTVLQVDGNWESGIEYNGPARGFLEPAKHGGYPNGFQATAKSLDAGGLILGLWTLPFARNFQDPAYKDKQDWFVKRLDGRPYDTPWGGTCLDLTQPDVRAQLAEIGKTHRAWGVRYFKMDGLWTGAACEQIYINDGYKEDRFGNMKPLHDPWVTNIEAYRSGLELLRKSAGADVIFSGCNLGQNQRSMTAIGLVDYMRIGPDFNHDGQGIKTGPTRASRLYFLNGRVWWNDPDPSKVRTATGNGSPDPACAGAVSLNQARMTTSFATVAGQVFLVSDWLPALPPERLDILKRTMLSHEGIARPVDYFDNFLPNTWLVTEDKSGVRRNTLALFNWEQTAQTIGATLTKAGLDPAKSYYAFDYWAGKPMADIAQVYQFELPAVSCQILSLRAKEDHPVLVSTSRHVMQGMVDVKKESWKHRTLSGVSELIANDPCELRIAGMKDGKGWKPAKATVSAKDAAAGVTIEVLPQTEEGWLRIKVMTPKSRTVKWSVVFDELTKHPSLHALDSAS